MNSAWLNMDPSQMASRQLSPEEQMAQLLAARGQNASSNQAVVGSETGAPVGPASPPKAMKPKVRKPLQAAPAPAGVLPSGQQADPNADLNAIINRGQMKYGEADNKNTSQSGYRDAQAVSDETNKTLEDRIRDREIASFDKQDEAVERLQKAIDLYSGMPVKKPSPLADSYANYVIEKQTGIKPEKNEDDLETPQAHQASVIKMLEEASKQRQSLTKDDLEYMKRQLANLFTGGTTIVAGVKQGSGPPKGQGNPANLDFQKFKDAKADIEKSVLDPIREKSEHLHTLVSAFNHGDYPSTVQALSRFARSVEGDVGRIPDSEIGRVITPTLKGDIAKLEQYFSEDNATPDPKILEQLKRAVTDARRGAATVYGNYLKSKENIYKAGQYNSIRSDINQLFSQAHEAHNTFAPKAQAQGGGSPYKVGQVFDTSQGKMRFKGGDWKDKANYEAVQ
jgi:hypothetical protein